jgi:hypothetical protein
MKTYSLILNGLNGNHGNWAWGWYPINWYFRQPQIAQHSQTLRVIARENQSRQWLLWPPGIDLGFSLGNWYRSQTSYPMSFLFWTIRVRFRTPWNWALFALWWKVPTLDAFYLRLQGFTKLQFVLVNIWAPLLSIVLVVFLVHCSVVNRCNFNIVGAQNVPEANFQPNVRPAATSSTSEKSPNKLNEKETFRRREIGSNNTNTNTWDWQIRCP